MVVQTCFHLYAEAKVQVSKCQLINSRRLRRRRSEESCGHTVKIGLILVLANDRETNRTRSYDAIRSIAQQAETDGFDSLWLPDNFFERTPDKPTQGMWECWTVLSALAEATARVEIGTLVL